MATRRMCGPGDDVFARSVEHHVGGLENVAASRKGTLPAQVPLSSSELGHDETTQRIAVAGPGIAGDDDIAPCVHAQSARDPEPLPGSRDHSCPDHFAIDAVVDHAACEDVIVQVARHCSCSAKSSWHPPKDLTTRRGMLQNEGSSRLKERIRRYDGDDVVT